MVLKFGFSLLSSADGFMMRLKDLFSLFIADQSHRLLGHLTV